MRFQAPLAILLTVLTTLVTGCGAQPKSGKSLASFSGGTVTESEYRKAMENLPKRIRGIALRQRKEFMESFITEKLLLTEAEKRGIQHLDDVENLLRQARQKILVAKLIAVEVESKVKISDGDAKAYYEAHHDEFMSPMRVRASHILLRSREEAESVLTKIKAGSDFGEMAKQFSLDPTASKGGDLGFFEKGQLILEIEEAAFAMKKDQLSGVIQTNFGFHLLKVTDVSEPQLREYESVKREIIEKLTVNEKTKHFAELTERLKATGKIKIDEKALSALKFADPGPETPGSLAQPEVPQQ